MSWLETSKHHLGTDATEDCELCRQDDGTVVMILK